MSKTYHFIFFDLDRTLWDFESNSIISFKDIFENHKLCKYIPDFESFIKTFKIINKDLWCKYRKGEIKKEDLRKTRFILTLEKFEINNIELAKTISEEYINLNSQKTELFPYTKEILEYLSKKYTLAIITNGFKEIQYKKLINSKIDTFFKKVICSEDVGVQKPNKKIFEYALSSINAKKIESIMIGDDLKVDIEGSLNFGIDAIYFNPLNKGGFIDNKNYLEIKSLTELKNIL